MKADKNRTASPVKALGKKAMKTTKGGTAFEIDVTVRTTPVPGPVPIPYPNIATTTTQAGK